MASLPQKAVRDSQVRLGTCRTEFFIILHKVYYSFSALFYLFLKTDLFKTLRTRLSPTWKQRVYVDEYGNREIEYNYGVYRNEKTNEKLSVNLAVCRFR